jgi:hypothetical protein
MHSWLLVINKAFDRMNRIYRIIVNLVNPEILSKLSRQQGN